MSFSPPPRGTGRHWRDDDPPPRRREPDPGPYPYDERGPYREPHPSDTEMSPPMYHGSRGQDPEIPQRVVVTEPVGYYMAPPVPPVDERLESLRRSALRWARLRDVVAVVVGLYLLGSWILPGVWRWLGG